MLSHYPPLGVDEGWFGNPAYNLATKGFLGATLMSGFYGTERHTYWMPPFHLLLMAGVFKVFGFGWLQIRLLSVVMGGVFRFFFAHVVLLYFGLSGLLRPPSVLCFSATTGVRRRADVTDRREACP